MVEPTGGLEFATEGRVERLSYRGNPIDDRGLHPFGVIGTSSVHAFLDLSKDVSNGSCELMHTASALTSSTTHQIGH